MKSFLQNLIATEDAARIHPRLQHFLFSCWSFFTILCNFREKKLLKFVNFLNARQLRNEFEIKNLLFLLFLSPI